MPLPEALTAARTDPSHPQGPQSVSGLPSRALLADAIADDVLGAFPVVAVRGDRNAGKAEMLDAVAAKLRGAGRLALPVDDVAAGGSARILAALLAACGAGGDDQGQPLHLLRRVLDRPGSPDVVLLVEDAETLPASLFRFMDALLGLARFTSAKLRFVLFGALGPWPGLNSPELYLLWQEDMCAIHYLPPLSLAEAAKLGASARPAKVRSRFGAAGLHVPAQTPARTRGAVRPWQAVAAGAVVAAGLGAAVLHNGSRMPDVSLAPPPEAPPVRTASLPPSALPEPTTPAPPSPLSQGEGTPVPQQPPVEASSSPAPQELPPPDDAGAGQTPAAGPPDPPRTDIAKLEPAAPEPIAPEPIAPEPIAPEPIAPELATPAPVAPDRAPAAQLATAGRSPVHGLVFIAQPGDTLATLYSQVYRNLNAPSFADVLAVNPAPIRAGVLVMFPEPPGGWTRASPDLRGGMRSAARGNLP